MTEHTMKSERNTTVEGLREALAGHHALVWIPTEDEEHIRSLITAELAGAVNRAFHSWSATRGLCPALFEDERSLPNTEHPAAALVRTAQEIQSGAVTVFYDLIDHLGDARTLRALREAVRSATERHATIVMVDHSGELPNSVASDAFVFEPMYPSESEIETILRRTVKALNAKGAVQPELTRPQLDAIVKNLRGLSRKQVERAVTQACLDDGRFDANDIAGIIEIKQNIISRARGGSILEFVKAPASVQEIGGLNNLKQWLNLRRDSASERAAAFGLSPARGVLLLGVQGAGKSLCAKAIATAWQQPLLKLDPGALYNQYVGESERRLRDALHKAEMMSPVVLWIDEIEKGFASAASQSNDGGLSKRMFGTLLNWMQEHTAQVFLVATANDIEALPPELLRKGRFDEIFFVDLPGPEARRRIFEIHLARRQRDPEQFDLDALVRKSDGYSGAEIEQAVLGALYHAFASSAELTTDSLLQALDGSPPISVTMREKIAALRRWAEGRCVPAG
ncbi:MAG: AAA family ATPase [Phycisphaerales bacterium JB065]